MTTFKALRPVIVDGDKVKAGGTFEHEEDAGLRRLIASGHVEPGKPKSKRKKS